MHASAASAEGWRGIWVWLALAALLFFVYLGSVHRSTDFLYDYDARYWHSGGVMWLRGQSPYHYESFLAAWHEQFQDPPFDHGAFVYPPTILPLSALLGAFPWDVARWVMRALNIACTLGIAVCLWQALRNVPRPTPGLGTDPRLWLVACGLLQGAALATHQGQMSLVATLGVCLVIVGWTRGGTWPVVLGFVLASMKPQVTLLPLIFLALRIRDRRILIALMSTAAVGALAFLWSPPWELVADLRGSIDSHMTQGYNHLHRYAGLPALFGSTSWASAALWAGIAVGGLITVVLARSGSLHLRGASQAARSTRPSTADWRALQMVVVMEAALLPIHRYDLTILLILCASLGLLPGGRRRLLLLALLVPHGHAMRIAWHARQLLDLEITRFELGSDIASVFAVLELALVAAWLVIDRRRRVEPPTRDAGLAPPSFGG